MQKTYIKIDKYTYSYQTIKFSLKSELFNVVDF